MISERNGKKLIFLGATAGMLTGILALALFGFFARAQAASSSRSTHRQCSVATLKGMYVSNQSGSQVSVSPQGPYASASSNVVDGRGHAHGIASQSLNGEISSQVPFTATYTLKPDCSGTLTVTISGLTRHFDVFTSPSGSRFTFICTDPGLVGTGVAVRSG